MTKHLKLRGRILLGYAIPILLSATAASLVYWNVKNVETQLSLKEKSHLIVDDTKDLAISIEQMQRTMRGYLLTSNPLALNAYEQGRSRFSAFSQHLTELVDDPQQQTNLKKIIELGTQVVFLDRDLIALVNRGRSEEAIAKWRNSNTQEYAEELDLLLEQFEQRQLNILESRRQAMTHSLQRLTLIVFLSTALAAGLAMTIGVLLASRLSKTISRVTQSIASSSTHIAAMVTEQERILAQQSVSVNQTTTTINELGVSASQSAEKATQATQSTQRALSEAKSGSQAVQETLTEMTSLKQKVEAIADRILDLSHQTHQIGQVTSLVSNLANRTNMLALNASVEAVRAGEQGKGFAIVAREIRQLADQSKKSADKINSIIGEIHQAIQSTTTVTVEGTNTANRGLAIAESTAMAFVGVSEAVNDAFLNSQQIALNAKQQAIAIQQIVEAMNELNSSAKETASGIIQTQVITRHLNEAILSLQQLVSEDQSVVEAPSQEIPLPNIFLQG